jgi:adenosylcobinamide amidohydrolase
MAKRPTNKVRLKVWTERSTAELEGGIKEAAYYLFMFVPQSERAQLLKDMTDWSLEQGAQVIPQTRHGMPPE